MSDTEATRPVDDLGRLIEVLDRQSEASRRTADLIESRALPLLERIALALERAPSSAPTGARSAEDGGVRGVVEFRRAVDEARWDIAEAIVRDLALVKPDDPTVAALSEELGRARQFAINDLRERIEAARLANDPEGVIGFRDDLARVLVGEAIKEVDRPLVKWLMALIQRRLRTGTVRPDVVALAARIGESFGGTTEGASLRASLPTLRRSAGLCPRCAEPYAGVGDACPKCLAASTAPTPAEIPPDDPSGSEAEDPDSEVTSDPIDLNNERFWQGP
jgi:hypothetical protein